MFVQHTYIEEPHKSALESTIRQHDGISEPYLAQLYKAALDVYMLAGEAVTKPGLIFSRIANDKHVVASVTDERNGFYMQLAGALKANQGRQLTFGQKWVMQGKADNLSTTATKLW
jgi:hypothetical protein